MKHPLNPTSKNEGLANAVVERIDKDRADFAEWWLTRSKAALNLAHDDIASALRMIAWEAFRRGSQHAAQERDTLHQHLHGYAPRERDCANARGMTPSIAELQAENSELKSRIAGMLAARQAFSEVHKP